MKRPIQLVFCLIILFNSVSANEIVKLATLQWPPYVGKELVNQGFTTAIVRAAFKAAGKETSITYVPWARALESVKKGQHDAVYPAYFSSDRAKTYSVSNTFIQGPLMFIKQKGRRINYTKLTDLKPYSIGTVRGYVNTTEFDSATYLDKKIVNSDQQNIAKLLKGRIDLAVIDKFTALNILATKFPQSINKIDFVPKPLEEKPLHVLCSRKSIKQQQLCAKFNEGLAIIKNNGEYKNLISTIQQSIAQSN